MGRWSFSRSLFLLLSPSLPPLSFSPLTLSPSLFFIFSLCKPMILPVCLPVCFPLLLFLCQSVSLPPYLFRSVNMAYFFWHISFEFQPKISLIEFFSFCLKFLFLIYTSIMLISTGVDLSKILGGQTKLLGGQKVVISDKCMGVSQLLGACARAAPPQVYAYVDKSGDILLSNI